MKFLTALRRSRLRVFPRVEQLWLDWYAEEISPVFCQAEEGFLGDELVSGLADVFEWKALVELLKPILPTRLPEILIL